MRLLSVVVFLAIVAAGVAQAVAQAKPAGSAPMIATAENMPLLDASASQPFQFTAPRQIDSIAVAPPDDVCYRIQAFVFRLHDDHAPQLLGSTTCGPRQPHAKNAEWPNGKAVPAK